MRKFLVILMLMITCAVNAQVIYFRTTAYAEKKNDSSWTSWQNSDMLLSIDLDNDLVIINSPRVQSYYIYKHESNYYDTDGDYHADFKFVDQDGDYGTLTLLQRKSGSSEVYIRFSNIQWCYKVRRI